ncbi:MAG: helicase HerA-like domain-containing protein [Desulfuromonadales bacterium]|nr:helicase HerA-like domain-containing protein [Desulfuromonadales bacterium]
MSDTAGICIGRGAMPLSLLLNRANRHGLIAGATGTGKTVTLQVLAEGFSQNGVPVFLADVKGDLSGLSQPGKEHPKILERLQKLELGAFTPRAFPTLFWDLFADQGHPVRTTVSDMGPLLLANLLELNDTQEGVLNIAFKLADEDGLLLLDFKDLRAILGYTAENATQLAADYGNVSAASVGAIQRRLLVLEQQGAVRLFGEPALDLGDLMRCDFSGNGVISILAADQLMQSPKLYSTFLLWLLAELFEELPEIGDPDKPKLVLFFDEAHLLFDDAPKALIDKIEQVVRLIRSKGVAVFFVTQNPLDLPDAVLGQLGNRVQHALRAFTPKEQKAVRAAAQTLRANPLLDTEKVITELGTGEALVSFLDQQGRPTVVQQTLIRPPDSRIGPATAAERETIRNRSPLAGRYEQSIDRESAHEKLAARATQIAATQPEKSDNPPKRASSRQSYGEAMAKSVLRSVGSQLGRQIVRGILGSIFKGR